MFITKIISVLHQTQGIWGSGEMESKQQNRLKKKWVKYHMAPVTRSQTGSLPEQRFAHDLTETLPPFRELSVTDTMVKEIRQGFENCANVKGREYKKYMVYAIFDYMCQMEPFLYKLGKPFGRSVHAKLNEFLQDVRGPDDDDFQKACIMYLDILRPFLQWSCRVYD